MKVNKTLLKFSSSQIYIIIENHQRTFKFEIMKILIPRNNIIRQPVA